MSPHLQVCHISAPSRGSEPHICTAVMSSDKRPSCPEAMGSEPDTPHPPCLHPSTQASVRLQLRARSTTAPCYSRFCPSGRFPGTATTVRVVPLHELLRGPTTTMKQRQHLFLQAACTRRGRGGGAAAVHAAGEQYPWRPAGALQTPCRPGCRAGIPAGCSLARYGLPSQRWVDEVGALYSSTCRVIGCCKPGPAVWRLGVLHPGGGLSSTHHVAAAQELRVHG